MCQHCREPVNHWWFPEDSPHTLVRKNQPHHPSRHCLQPRNPLIHSGRKTSTDEGLRLRCCLPSRRWRASCHSIGSSGWMMLQNSRLLTCSIPVTVCFIYIHKWSGPIEFPYQSLGSSNALVLQLEVDKLLEKGTSKVIIYQSEYAIEWSSVSHFWMSSSGKRSWGLKWSLQCLPPSERMTLFFADLKDPLFQLPIHSKLSLLLLYAIYSGLLTAT